MMRWSMGFGERRSDKKMRKWVILRGFVLDLLF
jgi:hypothetical protein